jgi:endonuclease YncB( thermonuclease family)
MFKIIVTSLAFCAGTLMMSNAALAHPGKTNAQGCHNDRKRGGYHCHGGGAARSAPKKPIAHKAKPRQRQAFKSSPYYASCADARAAGVTPLRRGDPGYGSHLDRDNDGVACEGAARSNASNNAREAKTVAVPVVAPLALSSAATGTAAQQSNVISGMAIVTDGDSLTINGQRIRLFGVDAFEAEQVCGSSLRCGAEATEHLRSLTEGQIVTCVQRDMDSYGRTVAICQASGVDLGQSMVRAGWAIAYRQYSSDYIADESYAQTAKAGAWRTSFDTPQDFRRGTGSATAVAQRGTNAPGACIIKGNINGKGEKIYHLPGQSGYQKVKEEAMFCSIAEAEAAGFRARKR